MKRWVIAEHAKGGVVLLERGMMDRINALRPGTWLEKDEADTFLAARHRRVELMRERHRKGG